MANILLNLLAAAYDTLNVFGKMIRAYITLLIIKRGHVTYT